MTVKTSNISELDGSTELRILGLYVGAPDAGFLSCAFGYGLCESR